MSFPAAAVGILRGVDPGFFPEVMKAAWSTEAAAEGVVPALFGRDALEERNAVKLERSVRHFIEHCPARPAGGGQDIRHSKGEGNVQTGNQGH